MVAVWSESGAWAEVGGFGGAPTTDAGAPRDHI